MKSINKLTCTLSLCVIIFSVANCARADFWRWTRPFKGPNQKIKTLIVTGNYSESRLLAELIQTKNRQPILMLPAASGKNIYFMPPQKSSKALQVPYGELTNFVNFIGANQIIILGNSNYVADRYTEKISKNQVIWRITGNNWKKIAASIESYLNLSNLSKDYDTLVNRLKSEVNYERTGEEIPLGNLIENDNIEIIPVNEDDFVLDDQSETGPIELIDASIK